MSWSKDCLNWICLALRNQKRFNYGNRFHLNTFSIPIMSCFQQWQVKSFSLLDLDSLEDSNNIHSSLNLATFMNSALAIIRTIKGLRFNVCSTNIKRKIEFRRLFTRKKSSFHFTNDLRLSRRITARLAA